MVVPPEGGVAGPPDDGLEGLRPIAERPLFGIMPNAPHQSAGVLTGAPYDLAFVEFDDQGLCYDREQMGAVTRRLDGMRMTRKDAIVLVFVHGWKHDARTDDDNLSSFRIVLAQTAAFEQAEAAKGGADARPVLGVFVGWRGLTAFGPSDLIADATFLGRQEAGHRVSTGSARELFGRLRHYRNSRLNNQGKPLLIIAGHSFGGMIVFSALAQSLIEAASDQDLVMDSRFADLVLLINPAIEGARYLPSMTWFTNPTLCRRPRRNCRCLSVFRRITIGPLAGHFPLATPQTAWKRRRLATLNSAALRTGWGLSTSSARTGSTPHRQTAPRCLIRRG